MRKPTDEMREAGYRNNFQRYAERKIALLRAGLIGAWLTFAFMVAAFVLFAWLSAAP